MFKQIRVSTGKFTIQRKKRKENRHASVLVRMYTDTNSITWRCTYICTTRRESLGNEHDFFLGIYCLSQRKKREYDPEGFLYMSVCVYACVRACGQNVTNTPGEPC